MERKYICIDCGKEFIINSSKDTHAKRCLLCRKSHNRTYQRIWKTNKRLSDPNYATRMRINWTRKKYSENPILFYRHRMFISAKSRALRENIPFNIKEEDILIPKKCPILNIPLTLKMPERGDKGNNIKNYDSPSLDKIIPSLGYVKGNIWVISYRANTIKNNCTFEEIEKLYKALNKMRIITGRKKVNNIITTTK